MACRVQDSGPLPAVDLIAERGFEGLAAAVALLIDEAMRMERERHRRHRFGRQITPADQHSGKCSLATAPLQGLHALSSRPSLDLCDGISYPSERMQ
jgi:hypothetical protein